MGPKCNEFFSRYLFSFGLCAAVFFVFLSFFYLIFLITCGHFVFFLTFFLLSYLRLVFSLRLFSFPYLHQFFPKTSSFLSPVICHFVLSFWSPCAIRPAVATFSPPVLLFFCLLFQTFLSSLGLFLTIVSPPSLYHVIANPRFSVPSWHLRHHQGEC